MTNAVGQSGVERFKFDFDKIYTPYPTQARYHASPKKHKLLGGAAGPGKTLALITEHMMSCNEFSDPSDAAQVHTLLLRRTYPQLDKTVITRFREKIPKELYKSFVMTPFPCVTWLNGATTNMGSMQHEDDVWGYQGQWLKISFDEAAEFTFKQWSSISAWNRCPVSKYATKDGASNPIGVGAGWLKRLFVDKMPCEEMDEHQQLQYNPDDYEYFPCTYLDNPVYANDPVFLANLEAYPAPIRDALKFGTWGIVGGYFTGAWDPAENVYEGRRVHIKPWWHRWLSGDWGHEHNSAIYWHCMDEVGIIRTYHELIVSGLAPDDLAKRIIEEAAEIDPAGTEYENFYFSHDAFHQKTDPNTVAVRMGRVLRDAGFPQPTNAGTDKIGREQLMYQVLKNRIRIGSAYNDGEGPAIPMNVAEWQISSRCKRLIEVIPIAPRDQKKVEQIAKFTGDDPIDGAGHGIYGKLCKPAEKPHHVVMDEALTKIPDYTRRSIAQKWMEKQKPKGIKSFRRY